MEKWVLKEASAVYRAGEETKLDMLGKEPVVIERDGKEVAVAIPLAEFADYTAWRENRERRTALEREKAAYRRLEPTLLETHKGRWVAIVDEKVDDADDDMQRLVQRVHHKRGDKPMYVARVGSPVQIVRGPFRYGTIVVHP